MIKKVILILLMVIVFNNLYSQSKNDDILYLKNGSVLYGDILEYNTQDSVVKIKMQGGSVLVYKLDEIENISSNSGSDADYFGEVEAESVSRSENNTIDDQKIVKGFVKTVALAGGGLSAGYFDVSAVLGYRFSPYFSLGLGASVSADTDNAGVSIPVFVDFKVNLTDNNKISPFIGFGVGVNTTPMDSESVGVMMFTKVGVCVNDRWSFAVEYRGVEDSKYYYNGYNNYSDDYIRHGVGASIAYTF